MFLSSEDTSLFIRNVNVKCQTDILEVQLEPCAWFMSENHSNYYNNNVIDAKS